MTVYLIGLTSIFERFKNNDGLFFPGPLFSFLGEFGLLMDFD